jgi:hypothetical protein
MSTWQVRLRKTIRGLTSQFLVRGIPVLDYCASVLGIHKIIPQPWSILARSWARLFFYDGLTNKPQCARDYHCSDVR